MRWPGRQRLTPMIDKATTHPLPIAPIEEGNYMSEPTNLYEGERKVPVPDPSSLTTQQLLREISNAVTLLHAEINGEREANLVRFKAIDREFELVESRRVEQKIDTKTAVDAALQAAKSAVTENTTAQEKAITKSETASAEQSKQQYATFSAQLKAVVDTVSDLKDRVGTIEAIKIGHSESKTGMRADVAALIGVALFVITVLGVFAGFIATRP